MRLGALDSLTNEYIPPYKASKERDYKCVECGKKVILRQGNIRIHHFAHFKSTNTCKYYEHPNEAQIHKDAKLLMQKLLNEKQQICFRWDCDECGGFYGFEDFPMIRYKDGDQAVVEFRDPENKWVADVALINNGVVRYIIEIKNTHQTTTQRPNPWYEIDAKSFIEYIQENYDEAINSRTCETPYIFNFEIPCIRKINRKCYGSFCYKEPWVRRIPGFDDKKNKRDNSCILCHDTEYIPTFDGCTGKFQNGCIRVCQDCLIKDIYEKQLRKLYEGSIERKKQITWTQKGKVTIGTTNDDILNDEESEILENIPKLWKKFGQETKWKQELSCNICKREQYSPVYHEKKFYAICKLCFDNKASQENIMKNIKENGRVQTVHEECLITDD